MSDQLRPGAAQNGQPAADDVQARASARASTDIPASDATAAAPGAADTFDFDAEYNKIPERVRTEWEQRTYRSAYDQFNSALAQEYGDLLPLVVEAKEDASLRKHLAGLTKKEVREFLFDQALPIWERNAASDELQRRGEGVGAGKDPQDFRDPRVDELQRRLDLEQGQRAFDSYTQERNREFSALQNEIGDELRYQKPDDAGYKMAHHIIKVSEERFERLARQAGVDTTSPTWVGDALSRGVKPPSYRDSYNELREVLGRSAPPTAPATSRSGPPERPQAPRTPSEGRERALAMLDRSGGFSKLAAVGGRGRRK